MVRFGIPARMLAVLAGAAVWLGGISEAAAQANLRWKFVAGQKLDLLLAQRTTTSTQSQGQAFSFESSLSLGMAWTVEHVDAASGVASIDMRFHHVELNIATPSGRVVVDTQGAQPAEQAGIEAWQTLKALVGAKYLVQFDARGRLYQVKLSEEVQQTLRGSQFEAVLGRSGIQELFGLSLITFPEGPLQAGQGYRAAATSSTPYGDISLNGEWTFQGNVDADGRPLSKLTLVGELARSEDRAVPRPLTVALRSSKISGVAWFDPQAGRMVESDLTTQALLNLDANGVKSESSIITNTKLTIRAAN